MIEVKYEQEIKQVIADFIQQRVSEGLNRAELDFCLKLGDLLVKEIEKIDVGREESEEKASKKWSGSWGIYSDELLLSVGKIVVQASWTEDAAGRLISLFEMEMGDDRPQSNNWAASGTQLVKALKEYAPETLTEKLRTALAKRNELVHGVIISTNLFEFAGVAPEEWFSLKRNLKKDGPPHTVAHWSEFHLSELLEEFVLLEGEIEHLISKKMGLKVW